MLSNTRKHHAAVDAFPKPLTPTLFLAVGPAAGGRCELAGGTEDPVHMLCKEERCPVLWK